MGLPDFLKLVLNFPNGEVLGVFNLLERVSNLVELGGVDSCRSQDLVDLRVFGFVSL